MRRSRYNHRLRRQAGRNWGEAVNHKPTRQSLQTTIYSQPEMIIMAKDPCCFGCDGCLNMLLETVVFLSVFCVAIGATVMPLIVP